jgi:cell division protein YceG involved in septum cleavage
MMAQLITKNYYFLTGKDGKMYYAKTFEEHKKNRLRYLN